MNNFIREKVMDYAAIFQKRKIHFAFGFMNALNYFKKNVAF